MKRVFYFLVLVGMGFYFSGCLVRTYTIQKPRTDRTIEGNQGYIYGSAPEGPKEIKERTRTVTVVEFELGPIKDESELSGKKGSEKEEPEESVVKMSPEEEVILEAGIMEEDVAVPEGPEHLIGTKEPEYQMYTVKKGDTLQKISYKFYGTHKKWTKIYKVNKDVLKSPDKVYPGIKLKVPLE